MKLTFFGTVLLSMLAACAQAQSVDTVMGTDLFATSSEPHGIAADTSANIYITDGGIGNRIVKYSMADGVFSTLAGKPVPVSGSAGTTDGFGPQARFSDPQGIVLTGGRLVVADSLNHRLRSVTLAGAVTTLTGSASGFSNGPLATALFKYPKGLAADTNGNIYVADWGNSAVRKVGVDGMVTTLATNFAFGHPMALAVGDNGDLWVADSYKNQIFRIDTNEVVTAIAGGGADYDSPSALDGQFSSPSGLLWMGGSSGLLISDTGNNTLRRLFPSDNSPNGWSLETSAGIPGQAGYQDAKALSATFSGPMGLANDAATRGVFIVDKVNRAVRRFRQSDTPLVKIGNPKIGYVIFEDKGNGLVSRFIDTTGTITTFNNDAIIAVESEAGTETFFTYGPTPLDPFNDTIPNPANGGQTPPPYADGMQPANVVSIFANPPPEDVTVKTISKQDGRPSSDVSKSQFQFKVAPPVIKGENAAVMSFDNVTAGAQMWYTLDGTDPGNNPPSLGPIAIGQTFSIVLTSDVTLKVRAFRDNFTPSGTVQQVLSLTNCIANQITFGFESGEASSDFVGAPGQRFYAPITMSLLPGQKMYTLQFNLAVTNLAPEPAPNFDYRFDSMLLKPIPNTTPVVYTNISPMLVNNTYYTSFTTNGNVITTNYSPLTGLVFTNHGENLLGVGWLERLGNTNLYDTGSQDLITYSLAHDNMFLSSGSRVIVGGYSFRIPFSTNALSNQIYQIRIGLPSATEDGISKAAFLQAPTNGSLTNGAVNAVKNVTVGIRKYLVGDVSNFRWFNAGDFGDGTLDSADVIQLFEAAIYGLNAPPEGSDFFDAMDSSDGTLNNALDGDDTLINSISKGDGKLDVTDIYVTFRRSLDSSLICYQRYWTNGVLESDPIPNPANPDQTPVKVAAQQPRQASSISRSIKIVAQNTNAPGVRTLSVPIQAEIAGDLPLRVMMMGLHVIPLDGSPELTNGVQFSPAPGLGAPDQEKVGPDSYGAAWYNPTIPRAVWGTNSLGTLTITLPESAPASAAYLVHFDHFSASPNGLGLFPSEWPDTLITLSDRSASSWGDGIPDSWRLLNYGSISNLLSAADADSDGDGLSNLQEFLAGTNPNDSASPLRVLNQKKTDVRNFTLQWPTKVNKRYRVEYSSALMGANWTTIANDLVGDGAVKEFMDTNATAATRFYRVLATP